MPIGRQRSEDQCRTNHDQLARKPETGGVFPSSSRDFRRPSFAGLVVLAGSLNPIPSRTRPLNSPAPMILSLKAWKSRSLPGLPKTEILLDTMIEYEKALAETRGLLSFWCIIVRRFALNQLSSCMDGPLSARAFWCFGRRVGVRSCMRPLSAVADRW